METVTGARIERGARIEPARFGENGAARTSVLEAFASFPDL